MDRGLTVGMINNFAGDSLGGGEVQLLELVRGLIEHDVAVTVACPPGSALHGELSGFSEVRTVAVDFGARSLRATVNTLNRELSHASVVQGTGFLTNIVARRVGAKTCGRVVNAVHVVPGAAQLDGESVSSSLARKLLDRSAPRNVEAYVAVSQAVAAGLVATGVPEHLVRVIHNGVDGRHLRDAAAAGLDFALPPGTPRIGFVGRLERVKGCEFFIRAAAHLRERYPHAAFVIAGTGSREADLMELASALDLGAQTGFLGHIDSAPAVIAALDVVVVPSLSEAFGLTALEALVLGTPVVASDTGGLPEVLAHGECGLLVPAGDARALANAVERLLDEPELAQRLSQAGRARAREHYSADRMVAAYLDLYRELAP